MIECFGYIPVTRIVTDVSCHLKPKMMFHTEAQRHGEYNLDF